MVNAVKKAAAALKADRDRAALELALSSASWIDAGIDDPADYAKVAGELRQALIELGLTPRSRAALVKLGAVDDDGPDPLDELADRRRTR